MWTPAALTAAAAKTLGKQIKITHLTYHTRVVLWPRISGVQTTRTCLSSSLRPPASHTHQPTQSGTTKKYECVLNDSNCFAYWNCANDDDDITHTHTLKLMVFVVAHTHALTFMASHAKGFAKETEILQQTNGLLREFHLSWKYSIYAVASWARIGMHACESVYVCRRPHFAHSPWK